MNPPDSQRSRLSDDDRALIRRIGAQLSQIILGSPVDVPDLHRRDELGILANMVSRLARELIQARRRDEARRAELERRVNELQAAYETQERLLGEVRRLSSPVLALAEGVLLVPMLGAIDATRVNRLVDALLLGLSTTGARAVIADVSGVTAIDAEAAAALVEIEGAAASHGATLILSGRPAGAVCRIAPDRLKMTPCADLTEALGVALRIAAPRADP